MVEPKESVVASVSGGEFFIADGAKIFRDLRQEVVEDLYNANVIGFTSKPIDIVTPFFVEKKGKESIRLVLDCRSANRRFKPSPPIEMASGTSWASLQLPPGQTLHVAQSDIKDCFYNISLPAALGRYFSLPLVAADFVQDIPKKR